MTDETANDIFAVLNELGAPNIWTRKPYQNSATAPTIIERIRGLHRELSEAAASAVLAEKALAGEARDVLSAYVGDDGRETLASIARRAVAVRAEAIRQRDEQVLIRGRAQQAEADALDQCRLATERADLLAAQWATAEHRAAALDAEAHQLRADVARLSNQLDYASELCLAGFRQ